MERPFNYIIKTHINTLVKPYDAYRMYQPIANVPRDDMIVKCIEETHRVYGADPTIVPAFNQMISKLLQCKYWWIYGTSCAIQNRVLRDTIIDKIIELFGSFLTTGILNRILSKASKLKGATVRKLVNINNGELINKTTISRIIALGMDCQPIINAQNRIIKKNGNKRKVLIQIDSSQIIAYILSDKQYKLFSTIFDSKHLNFEKLDYDFIHPNEVTIQLIESIKTTPVIKRIKKMLKSIEVPEDFGFNLYNDIIQKKFTKTNPPSLTTMIGLIIVIDTIGHFHTNIIYQIKKDIINAIDKFMQQCTGEITERINTTRKILKYLVDISRKYDIELLERKDILHVPIKNNQQNNNIDMMKVMVDPTVTSYDPVPDIIPLCSGYLYDDMTYYVSHLLEKKYMEYDQLLVFLISIGAVSLSDTDFELKLRENDIDIFNHPLTGDIINNIIRYSYDDNGEEMINRLIRDKHCFGKNDIDNIVSYATVEQIYRARLSIETDKDISTLNMMARRLCNDDNMLRSSSSYINTIVSAIECLSTYQKYFLFSDIPIPKKYKKEDIATYLDRMYDNNNIWSEIRCRLTHPYNIQHAGIIMDSEYLEMFINCNNQSEPLWLLNNLDHIDSFYELDIDTIMSLDWYLIRKFMLKLKSGEVESSNISNFIDKGKLQYWSDYRKGHFLEEANNFRLSDCTPREIEIMQIIDALPEFHKRKEEQAILESFDLLNDDNSDD
jgi:hypothetical protein